MKGLIRSPSMEVSTKAPSSTHNSITTNSGVTRVSWIWRSRFILCHR